MSLITSVCRPFRKARAFARSRGLKSATEWSEYCKSGKKPDDIPTCPDQTYADAGWVNWGDWLGTGTIASHLRQYRSFPAEGPCFRAPTWFESGAEWHDYCKSGKKPDDIPATPERTYAKAGWAGLGDWLGTGTIATRSRQYRSFREARAFVRSLHLKTTDEWFNYCKSGKKPSDIPFKPSKVYREAGWAGFGDWLGTGNIATFRRKYLPFEKARAFARGLGLKSQKRMVRLL